MEVLLPTLRGLRRHETYTFAVGPPLSCPITALGGQDDASVRLPDLVAWRQATTGRFRLHAAGRPFFSARSSRSFSGFSPGTRTRLRGHCRCGSVGACLWVPEDCQ